MRKSVSPNSGRTVARIVAATLLAGVASGCSSDASRFGSIFSKDTLTTASIPSRGGATPVPSADLGSHEASAPQYAAAQPSYATQSYEPSAPSGVSPARMAAQPSGVQRGELSAPGQSAPAERQQAMAQPYPAAPSQPAQSSGVLVAPTDAMPTRSPPPSVADNAARASATPGQIPDKNRGPNSPQAPEQKVAVLPNANGARDKQAQAPEPAKPAGGGGDGAPGNGNDVYTVKPGDSLAKIARDTGTPIDDIKAANNLTSSAIRVGQSLRLPAGKAAAPTTVVASAESKPDPVRTASVPAASAAAAPAAPAANQAPTKSLDEVASVDTQDTAPEATGIGKFRWPVTGAVVARYGQNVDGKRNDGINISVPSGTPVKAAENGVVIYAGNGLKELGNTVLVRHEDGTVTVYGHADNLAVQRGQKVQRGQQLATSGMTGNAGRPMLHFEVRKDATPVDPMTFLE